MRRRDDKIARAAHIKARTHGTSNEISFSVLDAAKYKETTQRFSLRDLLAGRIDARAHSVSRETGEHVSRETSKHGTLTGSHVAEGTARKRRSGFKFKSKTAKQARRKRTAHSAGYVEKSASQTPAVAKRMSLEQEIARRKARRRKGRIVAVSTVVAASLAIVSVGVWAWHCRVTEQQGYESELMDALGLVSEADETILQIDAIVDNPFAEESDGKRQEVISSVEQTKQLLADADVRARNVSEKLSDPSVREVANQTVISISARQGMIAQGMQLVEASEDAEQEAKECDAAWQVVLDADAQVREATKLAGRNEVDASKEHTVEAKRLFSDGRKQLEALQAECSTADFSKLIEYVEKRIDAMDLAVQSDEALSEKNKEEAIARNDAYNAAEEEAATMAASLPSDPKQLIKDAYFAAWAEVIKTYAGQRATAGTSDAVIRDYLGAQGK
ncbi:hypothetical protein [uncultured Senegalimassilia sp.]|uniref:hypothetical protein n=1 Tax=uncultured Senegalimassilia sp. TaxID=1714350 RepID=UPI0025D357EC|nr:hypothetical protein [uncultured Senegalimassilia sp.]